MFRIFKHVQIKKNQVAIRKLDRLKKRRYWWLQVHLWLGLTAGMMLVLVSLTGSVLVFWQELDGWLNPEWHYVTNPGAGRAAYLPLEKLVKAADAVAPPQAKRSLIYYPRNESLALWCFYDIPTDKADEVDSVNVFVNPYTGAASRLRTWSPAGTMLDRPLISFLFELHYDLLLGWDDGSWITGIIAILAFFSTLTGIIVWWPLTGKWAKALTIKHHASAERLNYDLHKAIGVYMTPVLLAVLVSGVYFNFGDQFRWLVDRFSPTTQLTEFKSLQSPGAVSLSLDEAIEAVERYYPGGKLYWFSRPNTQDETYTFTKHVELGGVAIGRQQFVVDQYSGKILYIAQPITGKLGDIFLQWQWPLHSGQAFGWTGRILVFLSGFACPLLFVTGVIRWLQKTKAKSRCSH